MTLTWATRFGVTDDEQCPIESALIRRPACHMILARDLSHHVYIWRYAVASFSSSRAQTLTVVSTAAMDVDMAAGPGPGSDADAKLATRSKGRQAGQLRWVTYPASSLSAGQKPLCYMTDAHTPPPPPRLSRSQFYPPIDKGLVDHIRICIPHISSPPAHNACCTAWCSSLTAP